METNHFKYMASCQTKLTPRSTIVVWINTDNNDNIRVTNFHGIIQGINTRVVGKDLYGFRVKQLKT